MLLVRGFSFIGDISIFFPICTTTIQYKYNVNISSNSVSYQTGFSVSFLSVFILRIVISILFYKYELALRQFYEYIYML